MKKITLLFAIIFMAATGLKAQTYETAVGAKFYTGNGSLGGINIKHSTQNYYGLGPKRVEFLASL